MKEIERNNKKDRNANEKKEVYCKKSKKGMLFGQKKLENLFIIKVSLLLAKEHSFL